MPITTAQDLVSFSAKVAGILGVGQTLLAEDNSDILSALNAMIGQWNRQRWLIYHLIDVAKVSTGAQRYTVGVGADFNTPRPDRLEAAFFRQIVNSVPNQIDYPLEILEAREDYNNIALKTLVSWPEYIFYDSAFDTSGPVGPYGYVYPWPVPQASLYEIHLSLKQTLSKFATPTQQINLPDEYYEALWTNLALRIAAMYPGAALSEATASLAKASLAVVRGADAQIPRLYMPGGLVRPALYNIFSDQSY